MGGGGLRGLWSAEGMSPASRDEVTLLLQLLTLHSDGELTS